MSPLETLLAQIIDKKKCLDAMAEQSPELKEVLALSSEYHSLVNDLREMCNPMPAQVVTYPYPVYSEPLRITYSGSTAIDKPIHLIK